MTCNVFGDTLNLAQSIRTYSVYSRPRWSHRTKFWRRHWCTTLHSGDCSLTNYCTLIVRLWPQAYSNISNCKTPPQPEMDPGASFTRIGRSLPWVRTPQGLSYENCDLYSSSPLWMFTLHVFIPLHVATDSVYSLMILWFICSWENFLFICLVGGVAQWLERRSSAGELSLSCARPAADGWPLCG